MRKEQVGQYLPYVNYIKSTLGLGLMGEGKCLDTKISGNSVQGYSPVRLR
jgi:hypothetical protein